MTSGNSRKGLDFPGDYLKMMNSEGSERVGIGVRSFWVSICLIWTKRLWVTYKI